jgi:Holliday junction resolvase
MGRMSKRKGATGEREAAKAITEHLGIDAIRGRQYCGAPDSPDVRVGLPGVHVEVKRCEALSLYAAIEQAKSDAGESVPIVLHRRNHREWLAIVPLDRLMELAEKLYLARAACN